MSDSRFRLVGFKTADERVFIGRAPVDHLVARRHPDDQETQKRYISFYIEANPCKTRYFICSFVGFDFLEHDHELATYHESKIELYRRMFELEGQQPGAWIKNTKA